MTIFWNWMYKKLTVNRSGCPPHSTRGGRLFCKARGMTPVKKLITPCIALLVALAVIPAVRALGQSTTVSQPGSAGQVTQLPPASGQSGGAGMVQGAGTVSGSATVVDAAGAPSAAAPGSSSAAAAGDKAAGDRAAPALFGRDFFSTSGSGLESAAGTASGSYVLGGGDRLAIHLGGKAQENYETQVTADGKIYLPTAGVMQVEGLTMAAARELLDARLRRLYSHYTLDLALLSPKMVRVAVTGDVVKPGNYTLSALNSVLDAVSMAQGPTERGSLRDIQVFRGEKLAARVDLYTHLLKPGLSADMPLQSGDKIFVVPCRQRVEISGEVMRPALYELAPDGAERLSDLVNLAGGFTDLAFRRKVELSRMQPDGSRLVSYLDWSARQAAGDSAGLFAAAAPGPADSLTNPLLANNDRIRVYSVAEQTPHQVVTIHGEVNRPGIYDWAQGMRLSDLILMAGSLTRSAWLLNAEVAQVDPNRPPQVRQIDLERLMKGGEDSLDVLLGADDQVFIRRIPDWRVGPLVEVRGEVQFPGYYPIVDDSTRLSEVMQACGGFTGDALISDAKLIRKRQPMVEDKEYERLLAMPRDQMSDREYEYLVMKQNSSDAQEIVVDFRELLQLRSRRQDVALRDGDLIVVPKTPRVVQVSGRVARPGGVLYKPGVGFKYYIAQAGGLSWDADGHRAKVIKASGEIKDDEEVKEFSPGDRIWVPRKPDRNYWQIFRDTLLVAGQLATIYLVIQNSTR